MAYAEQHLKDYRNTGVPGYQDNSLSSQPAKVPLATVIYTPDESRRQGIHIWGKMIRELAASRELIWRLIVRDISVRYRQSILGYVWAFLPPIIATAIFTVLADSRAMPIGETPIPYAAYAIWSLTVWQFFSACLISTTNSLANSGALVSKINFPKEALVIAAIGQPLFDFFIRLLPVALVFVWYQVAPNWSMVLLPLALTPMILLALGLGFFLSIANLVFRDTGYALGVVLTLGMFLAPVVYPPPQSWPYVLVNLANPFSPLLISTQDLIIYGALGTPEHFVIACGISIVLFLVGWRIFRLVMPRIAQLA